MEASCAITNSPVKYNVTKSRTRTLTYMPFPYAMMMCLPQILISPLHSIFSPNPLHSVQNTIINLHYMNRIIQTYVIYLRIYQTASHYKIKSNNYTRLSQMYR